MKRLSQWAISTGGTLSFHHAVKLLNDYVSPGEGSVAVTYSARDDNLSSRSWILYYAALTAWCFLFLKGHDSRQTRASSLESSDMLESSRVSPTPADGHIQNNEACPPVQRRRYEVNEATASVTTASASSFADSGFDVKRLIQTLEFLSSSFRESQWELLHEAADRLQQACTVFTADDLDGSRQNG